MTFRRVQAGKKIGGGVVSGFVGEDGEGAVGAAPRICTTAPIWGVPEVLRTYPEIAPGRSAAQTGSASPNTIAQVPSLRSFNFAPPPGGMQGVTQLQTSLTDQSVCFEMLSFTLM